MTYDRIAPALFFLAPPAAATSRSRPAAAEPRTAGECSLNPFATPPLIGPDTHHTDASRPAG